MYVLLICTTSWLFLLGAFIASWAALPEPRSTTDFAIIIVIGTATVAFTRIGLVSLLTLLIRLLPDGRFRSTALRTVLRLVPRVLRSSVLVAASASLAVQAAPASAVPAGEFNTADQVITASAASAVSAATKPALDPGWPTAVAENPPPDPGWPTIPPAPETEPVPESEPTPDQAPNPDDENTAPAEDEDTEEVEPGADQPDSDGEAADEFHIVGAGESLWSIALNHPVSGMTTRDIVDEIYTDNREQIGANPNLIMPGQRLEIQP